MTPPAKGRAPTGEHAIRVVDVEIEPRVFEPLTRDDVSDHALLPRRFDLLAGEVRDLNEYVRGTIGPAIKRIEERQEQERRWATRAVSDIHARLDEILLALKA